MSFNKQIISGWEGRLMIGEAGAFPNIFESSLFAFSEAEADFESDDLNVTNSEGEPASADGLTSRGYQDMSEGPGLLHIRVQQASFHINYNPFTAPFRLVEGEYFSVRLDPAGVGRGYHHGPNMKCRRLKRRVESMQLSPFDAEFVSDGGYTRWTV